MSAVCAAKGCRFVPGPGSLFCYLHPTPIQRKRVVSADDGEDWPWPVDAPPAPRTWTFEPPSLGTRTAPRERKLVVKWDKVKGAFVATHPNTNVKGGGDSPGEAVRNWQYWWNFPY